MYEPSWPVTPVMKARFASATESSDLLRITRWQAYRG